ncbi:hypothetical protein L249_0124 [Ophiocordyceps polyrhachis-furcata BCC 54312]|uniref:Uncharacterized protein n=1 Tax=Ophiocordyceps polyrhachis-furcata BCC 54312 TaxID=1330021 RepID=A0A367LFN4_9HYPO|nr:hypothetical protein L249_0124 [Ophiocordyceps polyrhachis-furcata BCC 54312]
MLEQHTYSFLPFEIDHNRPQRGRGTGRESLGWGNASLSKNHFIRALDGGIYVMWRIGDVTF